MSKNQALPADMTVSKNNTDRDNGTAQLTETLLYRDKTLCIEERSPINLCLVANDTQWFPELLHE